MTSCLALSSSAESFAPDVAIIASTWVSANVAERPLGCDSVGVTCATGEPHPDASGQTPPSPAAAPSRQSGSAEAPCCCHSACIRSTRERCRFCHGRVLTLTPSHPHPPTPGSSARHLSPDRRTHLPKRLSAAPSFPARGSPPGAESFPRCELGEAALFSGLARVILQHCVGLLWLL